MKFFVVLFLSVCSSALFLVSCNSKDDYATVFSDPRLYCDAVHELNTVVMGNNFGPIVASRNYLYASIAGYEVVAGGFPKAYQSLAGQLHGLKVVPKPDTCFNADAYLSTHPVDAMLDHPLYRERKRGLKDFSFFFHPLFAQQREGRTAERIRGELTRKCIGANSYLSTHPVDATLDYPL